MKKLTARAVALSCALFGLTSALASTPNTILLPYPNPSHASVPGHTSGAVACTGYITSVPAIISTPGTWCLNSDFTSGKRSDIAVTVATDGVTLECQQFALEGRSGGSGGRETSVGVYSLGYSDISVRHCKINGFSLGIGLLSGARLVAADNRLNNNEDGIEMNTGFVGSPGSVIQRNEILNTGSADGPLVLYFGTEADSNVRVIDNIVSGLRVSSSPYSNTAGIISTSSYDGTSYGEVTGNLVNGFDPQPVGSGNPYGNFYGFYGYFPIPIDRLGVQDNVVEGSDSPGSVGFKCFNLDKPKALVKDNTISHFETAISGCIDGGGNVIVP